MALLASSLAGMGVFREIYFTGAPFGVTCMKFKQKMDNFCLLFFYSNSDNCGTTVQNLESTMELEPDLIYLAKLYNGTKYDGFDGVWYFISTQKFWKDNIIK